MENYNKYKICPKCLQGQVIPYEEVKIKMDGVENEFFYPLTECPVCKAIQHREYVHGFWNGVKFEKRRNKQ